MSSRYSTVDLGDLSARANEPDGFVEAAIDLGTSERSDFDVQLLVSRLETYKSQLAEAEAFLRRQRRMAIQVHDTADTAAAVRFREAIEGGGSQPLSPVASRHGGSHNVDSHMKSRMDSALYPTRTTSLASGQQSKTKARIEEGLDLASVTEQAAATSRSLSLTRRRAGRILQPIETDPSATSIRPQPVNVLEKHTSPVSSGSSVSTPMHLGLLPDTPSTVISQGGPKTPKDDFLSMAAPNEDQIRREMEALAYLEGAAPLERSKTTRGRKATATPHVVHVMNYELDDDNEHERLHLNQSDTSHHHTRRRSNSNSAHQVSSSRSIRRPMSNLPQYQYQHQRTPDQPHHGAIQEPPSTSMPKAAFSNHPLPSSSTTAPPTFPNHQSDPQLTSHPTPIPDPTPKLHRTFSLFRILSRRRSRRKQEDTETQTLEFIEMYMDEEQKVSEREQEREQDPNRSPGKVGRLMLSRPRSRTRLKWTHQWSGDGKLR